MARRKLSEYRTKNLLYQQLGIPYMGMQITPDSPIEDSEFSDYKKWVVKVDQGVKKRGKQGLMKANLSSDEIAKYIKKLQKNGYESFIVEPMVSHAQASERYLCLDRTREGVRLLHGRHGGMEIERHSDSVTNHILAPESSEAIVKPTELPIDLLNDLFQFFNRFHFSFLEINPYVQLEGMFIALDAAAYIDSASHFSSHGAWDESDYRSHSTKSHTSEELFIEKLAASSQASFKYEIINPNGAIFMLLSGGGASVVLADEVYSRGYGKLLANYGEYSGNPNQEETYLYTSAIIRSLLSSTADHKRLVIAGGVANFTDIRATFRGIMKALDEKAEELNKSGVLVYVRRGGPHEIEALESMKTFLQTRGLLGSIGGHETIITDVIEHAVTRDVKQ